MLVSNWSFRGASSIFSSSLYLRSSLISSLISWNLLFLCSGVPETDAGSGTMHSTPTSPSKTLITTLANAGHTLSVAEAELVLNPLRLAFETKNIKIMELALDCLHVGACLLLFFFFCFWNYLPSQRVILLNLFHLKIEFCLILMTYQNN